MNDRPNTDLEFLSDAREEDNEDCADSFQAVQSITRSRKKVKKFEWKDDIVELAIDLWQNQPLLFDASHPNYHVKEKRRNCINAIIASLDRQGVTPLPNYEEVQRKLNALRTYYVAEKNKIEQTKVSGAGTAEIYKSRWQFFQRLSFLSDNITPRATVSNLGKRQRSGSDDDGSSLAYNVEMKSYVKTAKQADSQVNQLIEKAIDILDKPKEAPKQQKSADGIFAEMLGGMLETIPEGQAKDFLKMELQRLVYETKYMSPNRGIPQRYPRNFGAQSGLPFSGMLGEDPYQQTFNCPSPQLSTGSYQSSNRSSSGDDRYKEL